MVSTQLLLIFLNLSEECHLILNMIRMLTLTTRSQNAIRTEELAHVKYLKKKKSK